MFFSHQKQIHRKKGGRPMQKIAYLAIDLHAKSFMMGNMDDNGVFKGNLKYSTSEKNIIHAVKSVKAKQKYLTIEEGPLAYWAAQLANPYVEQVFACDPRENALIYKSPYKNDKVDTQRLCRLLRLGELKRVYHAEDDDRATFKTAVQHYIDLRNQLIRVKHKIKAMFRRWGVINVSTASVYSKDGRDKYLELIKHPPIRTQLKRLYYLMDQTDALRKAALKSMKQLGRNYPEIREFMKIPGIADIGAHVFDAFIQTPHRFTKKNQVWKYCRLSIIEHSSDGKPLGYQRLDRSGIGELKALSFRAYMSAMSGDNEVRRFYLKSLKRTHNQKHARLNTQRKIISVMYSIWKKGAVYRPELFSASA
jgi:transposase